MRTTILSVGLLTLGATVAPASHAQEEGVVPFAPFRACMDVQNPVARLACFEDTVRASQQSLTTRRDEAERRAEEEFGLSARQREQQMARDTAPETPARNEIAKQANVAPSPAAQETRKKDKSKGNRIFATVVEQWRTATGDFVLRLDNGQVWREKDGSDITLPLGEGFRVEIYEGFLGGFRLKTDGVTGIGRVQRIR